MPRPTLLLVLSLLSLGTAHQTNAQTATQAPILRGRVLDTQTLLSVPYASLMLRTESNGTLANAKGRFVLAAPKKSATDTLLVACPGYLPRSVALRNSALSDTTLTLEKVPVVIELKDPSGAKLLLKQLGSRAKQPGEGMIQGTMGSQFALLMEPSPKLRLGSIRNVSFYIGKNGFPKESFRIRLYRADGPNHSPGTNLLVENLIVAAPGGGQWFTVDIAKYDVEVPDDGFFVAMEWVVAHGTDTSQDSFTPLGQVLRPTFEFKDSRTWSFIVGRGWNLLTLKNSEARAYNAMIRAEIEVVK